MSFTSVEAVVVLTYRVVWFIGQAMVFWLLLNACVANLLGWQSIGALDAIGIYAILRIVISPPVLTITST